MNGQVELRFTSADAPHCRKCGRLLTRVAARRTGDHGSAEYTITLLCEKCQRERLTEGRPQPDSVTQPL